MVAQPEVLGRKPYPMEMIAMREVFEALFQAIHMPLVQLYYLLDNALPR
ncbi:hypothetical protein ACFVUS_26090 [Nocardia sp. NPDC058058]